MVPVRDDPLFSDTVYLSAASAEPLGGDTLIQLSEATFHVHVADDVTVAVKDPPSTPAPCESGARRSPSHAGSAGALCVTETSSSPTCTVVARVEDPSSRR